MIFLLASCSVSNNKQEDNWNSYLHDDHNTGVSSDSLAFPLQCTWTRKFQNPPQPAWPPPAKQDYYNGKRKLEPLITYDRAFQPVVHGNMLFVASSANNSVSCIDTQNGEFIWKIYTAGPNRVAPLWYNDRLYFGSDDGFVYCLNVLTGDLLWKRNYGKGRKLIGNGRVISSTPVRTGIVARGDTIFTAVGLLPEEYVAILACNALTGDTLWTKEMKALAPQGYPVLVDTLWYIPNSRVQPMAFSVRNGELSRTLKGFGGDNVSFVDGRIVHGVDWHGELNAKRLLESMVTGYKVTGMNNRMYVASEFALTAIDVNDFSERYKLQQQKKKEIKEIVKDLNKKQLKDIDKLDSLQKVLEKVKKNKYLWQTAIEKPFAVINVANAIVTGQPNAVVAYDPETGRKLWRHKVTGRPYGLAVVGGKLFVSTDKGYLYCFSSDNTGIEISESRENRSLKVLAGVEDDERIYTLKKYFDRPNGIALVAGDVDFPFIAGLNEVLGYRIVGVSREQKKIEKSRDKLDKAGLYGIKTTLFKGDVGKLHFSDYMFNVVLVNGKYEGSAENCSVSLPLPEAVLF